MQLGEIDTSVGTGDRGLTVPDVRKFIERRVGEYGDQHDPTITPLMKAWYTGAHDGESEVMADWDLALEDVLPESIDAMPSQVRAWLDVLEQEITLLRQVVRQFFEAVAQSGAANVMLTGTEEEIAALREAVDRALVSHPDDLPAMAGHVLTYTEDGDWMLQHPLALCAGSGDVCEVDRWAHVHRPRRPEPGRYLIVKDPGGPDGYSMRALEVAL